MRRHACFLLCLLAQAWLPSRGRLFDSLFDSHAYERTSTLCARLGSGYAYEHLSAAQPLATQLGFHLPQKPVDITTASTMLLMHAPGLQLVLDPLLYLKGAPKPPAGSGPLPPLLHMTMRDKHTIMPHQLLSMLTWGHWLAGGAASSSGSSGSGSGSHARSKAQHQPGPQLPQAHQAGPLAGQPLGILGRQPLQWAPDPQPQPPQAQQQHPPVPPHSLLLYDDSDIAAYTAAYFPQHLPTFNALKTPVERSDLWRYLVLCGHGGVYADTDTVAVQPMSAWWRHGSANSSQSVGLVVGIENAFRTQAEAEDATYVHKVQMVQWTMAARRGHPVVCGMAPAIRDFQNQEREGQQLAMLERGHDATILLRTGPGIWTKGVQDYMRSVVGRPPEDFLAGGQAGDLLVLPQVALGCNFRFWYPSISADPGSGEVLVMHMYNNSWKRDGFDVARMRAVERRKRSREMVTLVVLPTVLLTAAVCSALYAAAAATLHLWQPALARWLRQARLARGKDAARVD